MKISVISAAELDTAAQSRWKALQEANPLLASPYYSPEFTGHAAAVRDDVRIAVLEAGGETVGFFPHQNHGGRGSPAGGGLSDHHGVICPPGRRIDWPQLLRACGLSYWRFDHLPASQAPEAAKASESPGIDLSRGFEAWKAGRLAAGARRLAELDRKGRKMGREIGPVHFEPHVTDRRVFETVLQLKSEQCRRTGVPDFFALGWTRELVERIWQAEHPDFAGRLSALYAGDTLVAAHLGMRSRQVWHWWFPVYDHAHGRHSPGAQLLMGVAEAAAIQGHRLLDLGKGEDAYKQSFADCSLPLAEGWVCRPGLLTMIEGARGASKQWLRHSPLLRPLKPLVRKMRGLPAAG